MRDKSFEEINSLKLLILALSFVSVCTALILFLLLPTLKEYKQISMRENSQTALLNSTQKKLQTSEERIKFLRIENNKSLEQFQNAFDEEKFELFLNTFFKKVQIKTLKNDDEEYLKHSFIVQASMNNPRQLYDFIDALKVFESLVKIDYPLSLKAKDKEILLSFVVKIYAE